MKIAVVCISDKPQVLLILILLGYLLIFILEGNDKFYLKVDKNRCNFFLTQVLGPPLRVWESQVENPCIRLTKYAGDPIG